jgi:two-component system, cell cycle sensor histidine kinase PleC
MLALHGDMGRDAMNDQISSMASPADAFRLAWRSLRPDMFPRTPGELDQAVLKLRTALDSLSLGMASMPVSIVMIASLYALWIPWTFTFGWAAVCILLWIPCWLSAKRLTNSDRIRNPAAILDVFLRITAFVTAYGAQGALFWITDDAYNNLVVTVILVGSSVAAVMTVAWLPLSLAQLFVYLGLLMTAGFASGGVSGYIACLGFVFGTFMLGVIANLHAQLSRLLFLESHKDKLIAELTASNRAKSDFLANMSHELRTPMNAILGFSEIIKDEVMGPNHQPLYKSYAGDIYASGAHLLGLINDILDLSKIEAGKFELNEREVDAFEIIEGTKRIVSLRAAQKGVTLINDVPPGLVVMGDPSAMRQISLNLASNALKFTPAGGTIRCYLENRQGEFCIVTEDTGSGIRPEDIPRLFESFGQGRHDIANKEKGTGLGLPIVRGLARAHGGDVSIESELGKGTKVFVTMDPSRVRAIPESLRTDAA